MIWPTSCRRRALATYRHCASSQCARRRRFASSSGAPPARIMRERCAGGERDADDRRGDRVLHASMMAAPRRNHGNPAGCLERWVDNTAHETDTTARSVKPPSNAQHDFPIIGGHGRKHVGEFKE